MIKTHNETGLKYLCITKRKDWESYLGSGVKWKKHLAKYGANISTEILYESDNYNDFLLQCLYYSDLFNVVFNEEFANLIPEKGYETGVGKTNLELWWEYSTVEMRNEVVNKRILKQIENHWSRSHSEEEVKDKISVKSIQYWNSFTIDERREMMRYMKEGLRKFYEDKTTPEYLEHCRKKSMSMKRVMESIPFSVLSERNTKRRLNLSPEKKELRKQKFRLSYATGKHQSLFDRYSQERKGVGNPYAKVIVWNGIRYTKSEFQKFCKENNITNQQADSILTSGNQMCYREYDSQSQKQYELLVCPHCNKQSNKKPSSFKRWHFNNCKERV